MYVDPVQYVQRGWGICLMKTSGGQTSGLERTCWYCSAQNEDRMKYVSYCVLFCPFLSYFVLPLQW